MPKIIKDRAIVEDATVVLPKDAALPDSLSGKTLVPLALWLANRQQLAGNPQAGVWIDSDEEVERLADAVGQLDLIAINFPVFNDGRSFSTARLLRDRYGYRGELRAIGSFIRDQLFYLQRCGVNSFQFSADIDLEDAMNSFNDFSEIYQAASDQPQPLFQRR